MSIYIDLLLLAAIVTWVVDCSGFTDTLLDLASSFTRRFGYGPVKNLRPFTCSFVRCGGVASLVHLPY